jgi:predicted RNA-binding protein with PUA-like domain
MKKNDLVFFYHSVTGKDIRGIAKVTREAYPDPTTDDPRWVVVNLRPLKALIRPVTLEEIKAHKDLQDIALVKQSRLSVMPITKKESQIVLKLSKTSI